MVARVTFGLNWVRQRQRALTRGVLALFVLAWLQAAALPCVMAHADTQAPPAQAHDCVYCPPSNDVPGDCGDHGSCAFPHEPQVDARAAAGMFVALTPCVASPEMVSTSGEAALPDRILNDPIPRVPIPVSYCRFIE
jgi:hypothetical protein